MLGQGVGILGRPPRDAAPAGAAGGQLPALVVWPGALGAGKHDAAVAARCRGIAVHPAARVAGDAGPCRALRVSVPAAIHFQEEHDWPRVCAECHDLVRYARQAIGELTGLEPICPDLPEPFALMAMIPVPPCDAEELKQRLHEETRVEAPIIERPALPTFGRDNTTVVRAGTGGGRQFVRRGGVGAGVQYGRGCRLRASSCRPGTYIYY